MKLAEGVRMGLLEIGSNKMRSFLSFLGVLFGVATVLLVLAILAGMNDRLNRLIDLAGPGRIQIEKNSNYKPKGAALSKGLTFQDAQALRAAFPDLDYLSPAARDWGVNFKLGDYDAGHRVEGITLDWAKRDWVYRLRGRFFDERDMERAARVAVLVKPGPEEERLWKKYFFRRKDRYRELFEKNNPLGKTVKLGDHFFKVIGVLEEPAEEDDPRWGGSRHRTRIFIPLATMRRYVQGNDKLDRIELDAGALDRVPEIENRIRTVLDRLHRGEDDYVIEKRGEFMAARMEQRKKDQTVFLVIGLISLLAGGIGIMNVSLATVFSRIKEIGIRRAIGATELDIVGQFILESIVLASIGGLFGIALGAGAAKILPGMTERIETILLPGDIALCFGISVFVGFVFSVYPAFKAAKMNPVEALGHE